MPLLEEVEALITRYEESLNDFVNVHGVKCINADMVILLRNETEHLARRRGFTTRAIRQAIGKVVKQHLGLRSTGRRKRVGKFSYTLLQR